MQLKEIEKRIIERTITKITSLATKIRTCCFNYYDALTDISFPNVTSIGSSAFANCTALTDISFPNATSIGSSAFENCAALTDIRMPKIESLKNTRFYNTSKLRVYIGREGYLPLVHTVEYDSTDSTAWAEIHITGTVFTSLPTIGSITTKHYFEYADGDTYNFTPALSKGTSKSTKSYSNLYTDNTAIKDTLLSYADEYTTVTVKHLDGSDWV